MPELSMNGVYDRPLALIVHIFSQLVIRIAALEIKRETMVNLMLGACIFQSFVSLRMIARCKG